jgi:hypothetical protein
MNLRNDMMDWILENEMDKEKLREAQRLLDHVLREPKPPHIIKLDEYYTIGLTQGGSLKLFPIRKSYDADLRIKREIGQYGKQTLISVEVVRRTT